jgi:hypothetical protein
LLIDLGGLGLHGWQSLGGFLVFTVVRVDDLYQVLLIILAHSRLLEHFILCRKLLLLLHRYASHFHHRPSLRPQGPELCHVEKHVTALRVILKEYSSTTLGFLTVAASYAIAQSPTYKVSKAALNMLTA